MNYNGLTIRWSEADNAFIAEAPELPGCMADGKTKLEALENLVRIADESERIAKGLGQDYKSAEALFLEGIRSFTDDFMADGTDQGIQEERQAMIELDEAAERAGGYVCYLPHANQHVDYRGIEAYCQERGIEPIDMTLREYNRFVICDDE